MKKLSTLLFASLFAVVSYAQTNIPQLVSFSAVVRDANNQPLVNTPVSIRLTFKEGGQNGPLVYCALHQNTTNQNGFISLQLNRNVLGVGCNGAPSTAFESIQWENGGFWMEVEYQTVPGNPFVNLGQLELASSFYAFAAGTAERIAGFDLSGASNGDVLTYNITTQQWEPMPPSGTSFSGNYNDLTNAPVLAPVATSGNYNDLTNTPTIPTVPSNVSAFTNDVGYITTLNDDDPTNEIQQLSVSATGDTLHLQNGGFVIIPGLSAANTPAQLATLSTTAASSITDISAVSGGNITNNGGATITARGVVWNTSQTPTLSNNLGSTSDGSGTGSFTSNLSGLTASTTYYVRAYATNSAGTAYGNEVSFTTTAGGGGIVSNPGAGVTFDGYTYSSIVLGNGQEWMAENLRTTTYANGDPIPNVPDGTQWSNLTTGAWVHYNNDSQYENPYGKLYNWYTVADPRNVCPTGWHVPSDAEWSTFINYLDPNADGGNNGNTAGGKMKSTGTQYWQSPNTDATNESGFSGLPGGLRGYSGAFHGIGGSGPWWSSTEGSTDSAWGRGLDYSNGNGGRGNANKAFGFSVRCLRD
jgi:uncharacterized protein (TIGR02145 family)